jgi:hypothetical protein
MNEVMYNVPPSRMSTNRIPIVMLRPMVAKLIVMQSLLKVSVYDEIQTFEENKHVM